AELDGMHVRRLGGRHTFALEARPAVRRLLAANRYDVVVEDINKLPLFLVGLTDRPFCALVPHLFGATAFREASWPIAAVVWAAERPIPRAYRRAWFHAISESTRDDLVRRGIAAERVTVIYPGVDAEWYAPDATVARADAPTFLYVGRLKRYKGVEIALRALALAWATHPDLVLEVAGQVSGSRSGTGRPGSWYRTATPRRWRSGCSRWPPIRGWWRGSAERGAASRSACRGSAPPGRRKRISTASSRREADHADHHHG